MSKTVIVGSSFAGMTAALELRKLLPPSEEITVVSMRDEFVFLPSLIWVVQGWRDVDEITFDIRAVYEEHNIEFVVGRMTQITPKNKQITLHDGQTIAYDKLLIATGGEWAWDTVPGLQPIPQGNTVSILTPPDAVQARQAWQKLLADPGPIVVGVTMDSGLYGAAYEFALNLDTALRQAGIREEASITFVTPEPHLGHFGYGGLGNSRQILEEAFASQNILYLTEVQLSEVKADGVVLAPRRQLRSKFTMLVPPYRGVKAVRETPNLADEQGRIPADDYQRSLAYPDIFVAGVATQIKQPVLTTLPCGVFVPGTVSAEMGRIAAHNIAADLGHAEHQAKPKDILKAFYVLDSGAHGFMMSIGPQSWLNLHLNIPGPWSHWGKQMVERHQMWQLQSGNY